jgi:hypothetical protein
MKVISKSRILTSLALFLIVSISLLISLISFGSFDPIKDIEPVWQIELEPMQIPAKTSDFRWLKVELPQSPLSFRLKARYASGDLDSAYGIVLGREDEIIIVMVSPLGYVSIWQESAPLNSGPKEIYLPWQVWPHVMKDDLENEIYATLDKNQLSVYVNRERLWMSSEIKSADRIGIMGESFGGDATVDFELAEISVPDS